MHVDPYEFDPPKRPGNFGGETFREYCGADHRTRVQFFKGTRFDMGHVTTQELYIAINKHKAKKEKK
jgi:hypothetical protein